MSEDIKEILESSRKIIKSNRENGFDRIIMLGDDIDKLLDYITNLQEENVSLNNQLEFIGEQNKYIDKLENIIDELEKYLIEMSDRSWDDNGAYDDVLDKLNELLEEIE